MNPDRQKLVQLSPSKPLLSGDYLYQQNLYESVFKSHVIDDCQRQTDENPAVQKGRLAHIQRANSQQGIDVVRSGCDLASTD
jgi:hypothetical protein